MAAVFRLQLQSPPPDGLGTPTAQVGEGKECEDQEEQPAVVGRGVSHVFHGAARRKPASSPIW